MIKYNADSPRPILELLIATQADDEPFVEIKSILNYVRDSADWNAVAKEGDYDKVLGLRAMEIALTELYVNTLQKLIRWEETQNDDD